jgi:hypothetical protein
MKHVKILGLLVMAAAALMAFASSASANVLTSSAGVNLATGSTVESSLEKGSTALLKAGIEDTCTTSTTKGTISVNSSTEAEGPLSSLTFGSCTKDTNVIKAGSLTINSAGEVFTKESRVEVKDTFLGVTCFYGAEIGSVKIGTFDGGTPAKLTVNTTTLQKETGSGAFCASAGTWTANYVVTNPGTMLLN